MKSESHEPLLSKPPHQPKDEKPESEQQRRLLRNPIWNAAKCGTVDDLLSAVSPKFELILTERGKYFGESLLHIACLFSNTQVAIFLIYYFPELINLPYQGSELKWGLYDGETPLHIAVIQGDLQLMKYLLDQDRKPPKEFIEQNFLNTMNSNISNEYNELYEPVWMRIPEEEIIERKNLKQRELELQGIKVILSTNLRKVVSNVNSEATGSFFIPKIPPGSMIVSQKREKFYLGATPLSFAVCVKREINEKEKIIRFLVKNGARLDYQDSFKNSLLHLCVLHDDQETYCFLLKLCELHKFEIVNQMNLEILKINHSIKHLGIQEKYILLKEFNIENLQNHSNRTPLTFATELGKYEMVKAILNTRKKVLWTLGMTSKVAYPLKEIDTFKYDNSSTSLMLTIYLPQDPERNRKKILELSPFWDLLNAKWNKFAKSLFYGIFSLYILHLILIFFIVVRPPIIPLIALQFIGIFVMIGAVTILGIEVADWCQLGSRYFRQEGWIFHLINWTSSILLLSSFVLHIFGLPDVENIVMGVAGWLAYINILYFTRGIQFFGEYVVMLSKMILGDFAQFASIFVIFLFAFSLATYPLIIFEEDKFSNFLLSVYSLFRLALFDFEFYTQHGSLVPGLTIFFMVLFIVLTGVLMFTMLMASMNRTFSLVRAESHLQWRLQWGAMILLVERRFPEFIRRKFARFFRVGIQGKLLGLSPKEYYLIVYEGVDSGPVNKSKRLKLLFRQAILAVIHQVRKDNQIKHTVFDGKYQPKPRRLLGDVGQSYLVTTFSNMIQYRNEIKRILNFRSFYEEKSRYGAISSRNPKILYHTLSDEQKSPSKSSLFSPVNSIESIPFQSQSNELMDLHDDDNETSDSDNDNDDNENDDENEENGSILCTIL